jgi:hypothetical protein
MRFYVKLLLAVVIGLAGMRPWFREAAGEVAHGLRVAWVCARGDSAEFERLVDDTHRALAAKSGETELYRWQKRSRELLARRIAEAERDNVPLTDADMELHRIQCYLEALGDPSRIPAAARWAERMAEFETQLLRERLRPMPPMASSASAPTLAGSGSDVSDSSYAPPKMAASSGVKIPS